MQADKNSRTDTSTSTAAASNDSKNNDSHTKNNDSHRTRLPQRTHCVYTSQDAEQRTNAMGGKLQITTSNSEPTNKGTGGSCRADYASSLTTGSGRRYGPPPSHWQYICGK